MNESGSQQGGGADPGADFIRMWTDSCSRIMQAALSAPPDSIPPELLRQIRSGLLQTMAQSWDAYLRSPQFMEGMQQMMEGAVAFRKMTADVFAKGRQETQGVSREDIDGLRGEIRQSEDRILAVVEDLAKQVAALDRVRPGPSEAAARPAAPRKARVAARARPGAGARGRTQGRGRAAAAGRRSKRR